MVGQFGAIDEREQRMGFAGAHDLCSSSVMLVADVDDDRIISYSDDIKLDVARF